MHCRMCGKEIERNGFIVKCIHCSFEQAVPDESLFLDFEQADACIRKGEFERAAGKYEVILQKNDKDPVAYYMLALCRHGVQYVYGKDKKRWIPSIAPNQNNASQYMLLRNDEDYKKAMDYANREQKEHFSKCAEEISRIQEEYSDLEEAAEKCDIFISYKHTDDKTQKETEDAKIAADLARSLEKEGYRLFYAPHNLEDKAGNFGAYIMHAISTAKVMIVIGTKKEYFESRWVKNEWTRFLDLAKDSKGRKELIPVYRDQTPIELSSIKQMYNLRKSTWALNLSKAINSFFSADAKRQYSSKIKLALRDLKHEQFESAKKHCMNELYEDADSAMAYVCLLMAELKVKEMDDLGKQKEPFDKTDNIYYQYAMELAEAKLQARLEGYNREIRDRIDNERRTSQYNNALQQMATAQSVEDFIGAAEIFESIVPFDKSMELAKQCRSKAEKIKKDILYGEAMLCMEKKSIEGYEEAIRILQNINNWRKSQKKIKECKEKIKQITEETYDNAIELIGKAATEEQYILASKEFELLKGFRDADKLSIISSKLAEKRHLEELFIESLWEIEKESIEGYRTAISKLQMLKGKDYADILLKKTQKRLDEAEEQARLEAEERLREEPESMKKKEAIIELKMLEVKAGDEIKFGNYLQNSDKPEPIDWIVLEVDGDIILLISKYALDCKQYNEKKGPVTWEISSLRKWLNSEFMNIAFTKEEQEMIVMTQGKAEKNPKFDINPGTDTQDKIILLDIQEVNRYFVNAKDRQCKATSYAINKGAYVNGEYGSCWWLRSPGYESDYSAFIDTGGLINDYGNLSVVGDYTVRPSLRLNLSSIISNPR